MKINYIEFGQSNKMSDGNMTISWTDKRYGFGELLLNVKDDKIYIDTEYMGKDFVKEVLLTLADKATID